MFFKKLFTILFLVGSLTIATAEETKVPHPQLTKTYGCSPVAQIRQMLLDDHLKSLFYAESYAGFNVVYGDQDTGAWVHLLIPKSNPRVICIIDTGKKSFFYIPANEYRV